MFQKKEKRKQRAKSLSANIKKLKESGTSVEFNYNQFQLITEIALILKEILNKEI